MSEASIELSANVDKYFQKAVDEALLNHGVKASPAAAHYLVELLVTYAQPGAMREAPLDAPLTFLLQDALEKRGADRFDGLRRIGDGVLYLLGFFRGSLVKRGADRGYVVSVGASAYSHAARMLGGHGASGAPDLLEELSRKFDSLAVALGEVSDAALADRGRDDQSRLEVYERWMVTGSQRLQSQLSAWGMVPALGGEGVN